MHLLCHAARAQVVLAGFAISLTLLDDLLELKLADETAAHCANVTRLNSNPVVRENCRSEGIYDSTFWDVNAAGDPAIQGFAKPFSVAEGERVQIRVNASGKFRVDFYRLGYYQGKGARLIERFDQLEPISQPECRDEPETHLVDCGNWEPAVTWTVPVDAISGVYFGRLILTEELSEDKQNWRADNSQIPPSYKFANPDRDYAKPPPSGWPHAYGVQRLELLNGGAMGAFALKEPRASHAYFVVRKRGGGAEVVMQTLDQTWQAYNDYLAPSTYAYWPLPHMGQAARIEARINRGTAEGKEVPLRAYKTSYNRPFTTRNQRAVNSVFSNEYPLIRFLEGNGYDVSYAAGIDVHLGRAFSAYTKLFISVGHDEYWSLQQRREVERARDADAVNLAFFSGNEVYWSVRWEKSQVSVNEEDPSTMVIYKESQRDVKLDPDTNSWTGTFRDSRPQNPNGALPENALTGTIFTANAWRHDPLLVPYEYSRLRYWRDTDVARLKHNETAVLLKGLIGHEFDEDVDNGYRPPGLIRLSETRIPNVQLLMDHGSTFDSGTCTHHMTLYRSASGALVFGAGTVQYAWGLDKHHDTVTGGPNFIENEYDTRIAVDQNGAPEHAVMQATINLFADMGVRTPASLLAKSYNLVPAKKTEDTKGPSVVLQGMARDKGGMRRIHVQGWDSDGAVAGMEYRSVGDSRWHPAPRDVVGRNPLRPVFVVSGEEGLKYEFRAVDDSGNIGEDVLLVQVPIDKEL